VPHEFGANEIHGFHNTGVGQSALQALAQCFDNGTVDSGLKVPLIDQQLPGEIKSGKDLHSVFTMHGIYDPLAVLGGLLMAEDLNT
jgi:hypothetical protein